MPVRAVEEYCDEASQQRPTLEWLLQAQRLGSGVAQLFFRPLVSRSLQEGCVPSRGRDNVRWVQYAVGKSQHSLHFLVSIQRSVRFRLVEVYRQRIQLPKSPVDSCVGVPA